MRIPFLYNLRNLWTRRLTTFLTASGMALVVFVFSAVLMLAEGLEKTLVETGSHDNLIVIRRASNSEVQSGIDRLQASIIETQPEIDISVSGKSLVAKELVVLITLTKKGTNKPSNIVIRGIEEQSINLRPQVKLISGRMLRHGSSEIVVGASVAKRFEVGSLGDTIRFGMRDWTVVGIFDAGNTAFNSEIWGDVNQLMQAFRRPAYSSVIFRIRDNSEFEKLKSKIENDPRLTLDVFRETEYYKKQSEMMAKFLRILGISLTLIFSIGATVGAMITMYSAVANRVFEIGTMRAIGFQRIDILIAFIVESLFLSFLGGSVGIILASFLQLYTVSTLNFQTFSELAFSFSITLKIVFQALIFSLIMGFLGGVLPAFRASRMNIVEALRAS